MNTYTVHIIEQRPSTDGSIRSPYVVLVQHCGEGKIVASTSGCRSLERAESVARDYRAQFGVAEVQS